MITLPKHLQSTEGIPPRLKQHKKFVIIDTDAGSDDAHALLVAVHLAKQQGSTILGITCVSGNTQLPLVIKNVKISLALAGAPEIPVYAGCDCSLSQQRYKDNFFLEDGLSGHQQYYLNLLGIDAEHITEKEHAVDFLIQSIKKYKEELTLVFIGPFTNLACALIKDHTVDNLIGTIIFLGGNMCGVGIAENGVSEFNAYADVEAIHLVFKVLQDKLVVVPFESVQPSDEKDNEHTFEYKKSEKGRFVQKIYESMLKFNNRYDIQDPLSVMVAFCPEVVTGYVEQQCYIIVEGEGRGLVALDWNKTSKLSKHLKDKKVTFVTRFDMNKVNQILHETVREDHQTIIDLLTKK